MPADPQGPPGGPAHSDLRTASDPVLGTAVLLESPEAGPASWADPALNRRGS